MTALQKIAIKIEMTKKEIAKLERAYLAEKWRGPSPLIPVLKDRLETYLWCHDLIEGENQEGLFNSK